MTMAWQPQEEPLRQLAGYLRDSLSGHDQNAQKNATVVSFPTIPIASTVNPQLECGRSTQLTCDLSYTRCSPVRKHPQTTLTT